MIFPNRLETESGQDFVNRLMLDPVILNSMGAENKWPKAYKCRFIEPGLVNYADFGTVMVSKEALDRMAKSFIGKPVVNVIHKDVSPRDFAMGAVDGIVADVWFDQDGWYWAKFLVWDPATQKNCESPAYSVSCAYDLIEAKDEGGTHNNIPYNQEVVNGEYTHLAIVANPRYEGARILYNSKGGKDMKWKFWQSNGKEKVELQNISEDSTVEVDGKEVPIKTLVEMWNSSKPVTKVGIESIIEVDGTEIPVKDLVAKFTTMKNAEDKDEKEKKDKEERENAHKSGSHKTSRMSNCKLCNAEDDADKKKKEADEKKNAEDKEKEDKEKRENDKNFVDLRNAAQVRGQVTTPTLVTRQDRIAEGAKRYGSEKVTASK